MDIELGNLIFGNSRGECQIDRGVGFEDELVRLFESYAPDRDNSWREYGINFENDIFSVFTYYWGECTCGFLDYKFEEKHKDDCYQSELKEKKIKAGWKPDKTGYLECPESWSLDKEHKIEDNICKPLCKKYGLSFPSGCVVHCTCDMNDRYEKWLKDIGYSYGHKDDCLLVKPNFNYKPSDYRLKWYKYPLRDSYANKKISLAEFRIIINECIRSIK